MGKKKERNGELGASFTHGASRLIPSPLSAPVQSFLFPGLFGGVFRLVFTVLGDAAQNVAVHNMNPRAARYGNLSSSFQTLPPPSASDWMGANRHFLLIGSGLYVRFIIIIILVSFSPTGDITVVTNTFAAAFA